MIKPKFGKCIDCEPNEPEKPLTAKRCPYHYGKYRSTQWKRKTCSNKPKTPIKKKSTKQAVRDRKYLKIRARWITEHPVCEMRLVPGCTYNATDVHHMKGKIGDLFFDTEYFKAACRFCHDYVEAHPEQAKRWGFSVDRLAQGNAK